MKKDIRTPLWFHNLRGHHLQHVFCFPTAKPHKDTYIVHTEHISIYVNAKASKSTNGWKVVKIGGLMWFTILLRSATQG